MKSHGLWSFFVVEVSLEKVVESHVIVNKMGVKVMESHEIMDVKKCMNPVWRGYGRHGGGHGSLAG